MASRQGGVHISYLVVAIVICLLLVGAFVAQNSNLNDRQVAIDRLNGEKDALEKRIRDYAAEQTQARMLLIGDDTTKPDYENMTKWVTDAGVEYAKANEQKEPGQYTCLQDVMHDSFTAIQFWRKQHATQRAKADSKDTAHVEALSEGRRVSDQKDEEINTLRGEKNDLQVQLEKVRSDASAEKERLQEELENAEEQSAATIAQIERRLQVEVNLHAKTQRAYDALRAEIVKEKTFDKVEPDGEIVTVLDDLGFAWINLGREQRVRRGTVFDVFNYIKGGKRQAKGRAEVVSVDGKMSKVRILETYDELNPLLPGDKIASPFYSVEDEPVFVIAGAELSSRRIDLEELVRKVGNFGGKVEDKVRIGTSYLVAVSGYEQDPEYKEARELGVTVLREAEFLKFIGY